MKKITDVNDLVKNIAALAVRPMLSDEVWKCYGYKKRPKHGDIWNKIFPKMFALENFISKEVFTMSIIDVLNGIKKSKETSDTKLLILLGVVDQLLYVTKSMYPADSFMENIFSTYESYLKRKELTIDVPIIWKAKGCLRKKDFVKFMFGTIRLLPDKDADDFLIKSDYIKDLVEKSGKENKLNISMSKENFIKYVPLIETKILNT